MSKLLQDSAFFCLAISLIGYEIGIILRQKTKLALCNPLLISIVFVIIILKVTNIKYEVYEDGSSLLSYLLTPSTVCLAIPLHQQMGLLKKNLERFHREFPGAHIKVTNATSIRCVELLETGQVDLIVVNSPNAYLGNVPNVKKIKDFQDVFIADKAFEELKGKKLSFKELLNYPILMLDRKSTTSEYLHNLFLQNQLDLVPEIELSSNDLLIDLARIGLGIAFIPDFCLSQTADSDSLFIVETKESLPERELVIAHNEKVPVSKAAQ